MISKLIKTTTVAALMFLGTTAATQAATVTPLTLGDTGTDYIGTSYGASELSVSQILNNYGFTIGGSAVNTTTNQTQTQTFQVTGGSADFTMTLLDTYAAYDNDVYVWTTTDGSSFNEQLAFTNNIDALGTSFDFTVADGDYFGFLIHADGNNPPVYNTANALSSDGLDHALVFSTDQGTVVAFEDLPYKHTTGLLGDQDYNDVVFSFTTSTVPEPASAGLLILGAAMLMGRPKRRTA
jgi:hypothetical protein